MTNITIFETQDGSHSLFSEQYGVAYHSKYGAIQETQHVFINAALRFKALFQSDIAILDMGFGTGLNAYMTLLAAYRRGLTIDYTAVEAFPITLQAVQQLNYTGHLKDEIFAAHFLQLHTSKWEMPVAIQPFFNFQKHKILFETIDFDHRFDIIYFDAFAPNAQPELWEAPMLKKMFVALRPGGVLVTYCAKGVVKRTLKSIGFEIESLKGPPGKREMTRAVKPE